MLKYYSFSRLEVWDEIPMAQGYAYITVAIENDGWMQFNGVKPKGKTYVEAFRDELVQIAKEAWSKADTNGSQNQNTT